MVPPGCLVQRVAQRVRSQASWRCPQLACRAASRSRDGGLQLHRPAGTALSPVAESLLSGRDLQSMAADVAYLSDTTARADAIQRADTTARADAIPVFMVCTGVAAIGAYALHVSGNVDAPLEVKSRLKAEDFAYVCEGEESVLCRYVGRNREWRGCLLQLVKEPPEGGSQEAAISALRLRAEFPRKLALHCFEPHVVDRPQLVSVAVEDARELDAQVFAARPAGRRSRRLLSDSPREADSGRIVALRFRNVFEGPPAVMSGVFSSLFGEKPMQLLTAPLLTVDIRPGCGLQEIEGLPSRDALRACAASGQAGDLKQICAADPVALFSSDAEKAAAVLRARLQGRLPDDDTQVFLDCKPVYPTILPEAGGDVAPTGASSADSVLKHSNQQGCLPSSEDELVRALASVLTASGPVTPGRDVLSDLRLLQCYAAGEEVEKMAEPLLQDLEKRSGPEGITPLGSSESIQAAVYNASWRRNEKERLAKQQQQGRKFMALKELSKRQEANVHDWLSSFLLGRAAFGARLLISFASVDPKVATDSGLQSYMREYRFLPLKDFMPDTEWCTHVWVRITVVGMEKREASDIPRIATELEECVNRYRELSASAS